MAWIPGPSLSVAYSCNPDATETRRPARQAMAGARRAGGPSSILAAYSVPRIDDAPGSHEKLDRPPPRPPSRPQA